jgi:hypothetical protein
MTKINEIIEKVSPYYAKRGKLKEAGLIGNVAETEHKLIYDSSSETLEPIYFFILDLIEEFGYKTEKLVDNFTQSPSSSNFAEMGQRKTIMQQQAGKIMVDVNAVLRSVLNIIYDLKEFRIRLQSYEDLKNSKNKEAALLSLKQIWMDKVDINKGNSSLKAMGLGQAGFSTLIDAFLVVKKPEDVKKLDLNDRIKRILLPRVKEFYIWLKQSETELKKRYKLEKIYLKSQVSSLKLYSRWARPYLKAASDLEGSENKSAGLVKSFNTTILELTILGRFKTKVKGNDKLSIEVQKLEKSMKRNYNDCILIDFVFRAIPKQGVHIGRSEITFRGYALNDEELEKMKKELEQDDMHEVLNLIEGSTTESLGELQEEINFFLDENEREEKEEKKSSDGSNPFVALIGGYNKKSKKSKDESKTKDKPIKKDNYLEKNYLRKIAAGDAQEKVFTIFDVYKKSHGMPSYT